ncbi:TIGR03067 domain-containing protein [Gemmata sp. G18]|uniref:TIGR03067 domain-containing protein n=1 Tax=Gemmata palustris TaxID=2822762 RepID=A0ABS5BRH9_9BACT|nr:TIGR03067 domain-containing protein [Gemmata palustris]MBP3956261.1 TIGR03067 domain-containing protein [Gemmata palustris]
MRALVATVLCLCPVGHAVLTADDKKSDSDLFQGTWEVVKLEQTGQDLAEVVKALEPTMAFEKNTYTFTLGENVEKGKFTLDPKAKVPTVDYDITEGEQKGKKQVGIYKLDGDTLVLCLSEEGADARPTKFKTAADAPEYVMFTLKRKKK